MEAGVLDLEPADPAGDGTGRELDWAPLCEVGVGVVHAVTSFASSPGAAALVLLLAPS